MTVEYRIVDNDDDRFPDHTLIETWQDGVCVARSWAPDDVDPGARLNIDHPIAVDARTTTDTTEIAYHVPTNEEAKRLRADDPDQRRVAATYAAVVEAVTLKDAAAAVELPEKALVDEARAWAAFVA